MRLRTLRAFALLLAAALAFSQVALASFACPMQGQPAAEMYEAMESGHCAMAPEAGDKTLCLKTCQDEPLKHDVPALDLPVLPASPGLRVEPAPVPSLTLLALPPDADVTRVTSPPPYLRFARFLK